MTAKTPRTDPQTDLEWADKLDNIANAISQTLYDHGIHISKGYKPERLIGHDDYDLLRVLAKELRVREYRRLLAAAEAAK